MAIFTFKDIVSLDDWFLGRILWETDYHTLISALKTEGDTIRNKLLKIMLTRTAAKFKSALKNNDTISQEESEASQLEIIRRIKTLVNSGRVLNRFEFTFPDFPGDNVSDNKQRVAEEFEKACKEDSVQSYLSICDVTKDDLREGFKVFMALNNRTKLTRIRSLNISCELLPVLAEFQEADELEIFPNLTSLSIDNIDSLQLIPKSICNLQSLTKLSLSGNENFKTLPDNIGDLKSLTSLKISGLHSIKQLPDSICNLQCLTELSWRGYINAGVLLDSISNFKNLTSLNISGSDSLDQLPDSIGNLQSLTTLSLYYNRNFKVLPDSIGNLKNLTSLNISFSNSLEKLPDSIGNLQSLEKLSFHFNSNLKALPASIGDLKNLTSLDISGLPSIEQMLDSIGNLKNLTSLNIFGSDSLEKLPDSIGNLQSLEKLSLQYNKNLKALPDSIGNLENLTSLNIYNSASISYLPDSVVNLASLEYVNVRGTSIQDIPPSVSLVKTFIGNKKRGVIIPLGESISYRGFVNSYYRLIEAVSCFCQNGKQVGLLALEEDLDLSEEDDFIKRGVRLVVGGTDAEVIRHMLTIQMEREHDFYRKKLMGIAINGILGIQAGSNPSQLIFRLNLMVDIKDNPIDAAYEKYLCGNKDAFLKIDFASAIQPEQEREEVSFMKRALRVSEIVRREGFLAVENHLDADGIAERDVFEYGLSLLLDGANIDIRMGIEEEYLGAVLGKLVERENDPVQKNIALAKKEAVLSICAGDNPRILACKLLDLFDNP